MELDARQLKRLNKSKKNLVEALKGFTETEDLELGLGDMILTYLCADNKSSAEAMIKEYRSVVGDLVDLIKSVGSVEVFVDTLVEKMKKLELSHSGSIGDKQYVSIPMASDKFLVLKLRITKDGLIVGYVEYWENRRKDGFKFLIFYEAIMEVNGLLDPEIDYWPL